MLIVLNLTQSTVRYASMCKHFVVHLQLSLSAEYFLIVRKMPPKFHLKSLMYRLLLVRINPQFVLT